MTATATVIRTIIVTNLALSYDEIATRLGITIASSRRLVHRKRWMKAKANDGRALVQVPVDFLDSRPDDNPGNGPNGSQHDSPNDSPSDGVVEILARLTAAHAELIEMARRLGAAEGEVERLRDHLAFERGRAERLSGEAAGVAGLKATLAAVRVALETERGWLAEIRAERDRLLNRSWWQRLVGQDGALLRSYSVAFGAKRTSGGFRCAPNL